MYMVLHFEWQEENKGKVIKKNQWPLMQAALRFPYRPPLQLFHVTWNGMNISCVGKKWMEKLIENVLKINRK